MTNFSFRLSAGREPLARLRRRDALHSDSFSTAELTAGNRNGRARYFQKICQKFNAGLVGAAIYRGRLQRNLDRVAEFADDPVTLGPRLNLYRKAHRARKFFDLEGAHLIFSRSPKIAVPRRTQV